MKGGEGEGQQEGEGSRASDNVGYGVWAYQGRNSCMQYRQSHLVNVVVDGALLM